MLTARGDVSDRVVGLELGADDYLAKPFEPRELAARIQAVLRRGDGKDEGDVERRFGRLVLDPARREAKLADALVELSTSEFDVLWLLATHPSKVWTRDQIMNAIRGIDWTAYDRSVDVLVSRVRQKLGDDPRTPTFIKTVRGAGYAFIARRDDVTP
jgi:DNA-binding response OmpR family regulator